MSDAFDADGHCRRYPPQVKLLLDESPWSYWPEVSNEDSCGEFQDGKKEEFEPPEIIDL